jgi:hypothetical protein
MFTTNLKEFDKGELVRELQSFLLTKGYIKPKDGLPSDYYGQITKDAVFRFQKDHNIVKDISQTGAGDFGPKTRETANQMLDTTVNTKQTTNTPRVKVPSNLSEIRAVFGDERDPYFEQKYIVSVPFPYTVRYDSKPVTSFRCHKLLKEAFTGVFMDILNLGLTSLVDDYGGVYQRRSIRGATNPSCHTWGIAIDIEPAKYPLHSTARFDQRIVDIFKKHGFEYGGDFQGRKDPMHFQYCKLTY